MGYSSCVLATLLRGVSDAATPHVSRCAVIISGNWLQTLTVNTATGRKSVSGVLIMLVVVSEIKKCDEKK